MATEPTKHYEQFQPPERLTLLIEAMARDDAAEARRLQDTCPRLSYTGPDVQFTERYTLAFDVMAVVTIDLRCCWAKLHVMRCVLGGIRDMAVAHKITAALAFVDGERCGRGQKQCEFFGKPLPSPKADEGDEGEADPEDDLDQADDGDEVNADEEDEEVVDPTAEQIDRGVRMDAVERRVEQFTTSNVVEILCVMDDIARDLVNTWAAFGAFCRSRLGVEPETMMRAWQFPLDDFLRTLRRFEKTKSDPAKVKEYFGYITKQWDCLFRRRRAGDEYVTYQGSDAEGDGEGDGTHG